MSAIATRDGARTSALLFPGQGAPIEGERELVEASEPALLDLAAELVGCDPLERAGDATAFAQPAILVASLARYTRAGRPAAEFIAGHSLGELTALVAAGALAPEDGVRLAVARGRLMQEVAGSEPGGMLALLGDRDAARVIIARSGAIVANDNAPTQLVAAGSEPALELAAAEAKAGGLRTIRLGVRGAFHSPSLEPAVDPFRAELERIELAHPRVPVLSSITARPFPRSAPAIRDQLAEALVRPVRWRQAMLALRERGVVDFREVGPGKALTGMVKRTLDDVDASVLEAEPSLA